MARWPPLDRWREEAEKRARAPAPLLSRRPPVLPAARPRSDCESARCRVPGVRGVSQPGPRECQGPRNNRARTQCFRFRQFATPAPPESRRPSPPAQPRRCLSRPLAPAQPPRCRLIEYQSGRFRQVRGDRLRPDAKPLILSPFRMGSSARHPESHPQRHDSGNLAVHRECQLFTSPRAIALGQPDRRSYVCQDSSLAGRESTAGRSIMSHPLSGDRLLSGQASMVSEGGPACRTKASLWRQIFAGPGPPSEI